MIEKLRKFTLENDLGKTILLKPMPKLKDIKSLKASIEPGGMIATKYFVNTIVDGKIQTTMIGHTIFEMIRAAMHGYYALINPTREDQYVGQLLALEKEDILPLADEDEEFQLGKDPIYPEFEYIERFNPYDVKNNKWLTFDISERDSFMKIDMIRWVEGELLWSVGDPKEKILSMYDDVPTLKDMVEAYKNYFKSKFPKALFDEEASKAYWTLKQMEGRSKREDCTVQNIDDLFKEQK